MNRRLGSSEAWTSIMAKKPELSLSMATLGGGAAFGVMKISPYRRRFFRPVLFHAMFDDRRWLGRTEPRVGRRGFQTIWICEEGIRGRHAELGFSIRDPDREGRIPEMRDALAGPDRLDFKKGRKNLIFGS